MRTSETDNAALLAVESYQRLKYFASQSNHKIIETQTVLFDSSTRKQTLFKTRLLVIFVVQVPNKYHTDSPHATLAHLHTKTIRLHIHLRNPRAVLESLVFLTSPSVSTTAL